MDEIKKDILMEMSDSKFHNGLSWADIILRNSTRIHKDNLEGQKEFWSFLMNQKQQNMTFTKYDPDDITIKKTFTANAIDQDDEKETSTQVQFENDVHREGFVSYISTKPVLTSPKHTSCPDPIDSEEEKIDVETLTIQDEQDA